MNSIAVYHYSPFNCRHSVGKNIHQVILQRGLPLTLHLYGALMNMYANVVG